LENLKIAFIIFEFGAGGQERQVSYALEKFIDKGLKPLLFIWNSDKTNGQNYGIPVSGTEIIYLQGRFTTKIFQIRSVLISKKIRLFQSWSILMNIILFFSTIYTNIITFGALRGKLFGFYIDKTKPLNSLKIIIQLIFVKNIICNSQSALNDMKKLFKNIPFVKKKVFFLQNRTIIKDSIISNSDIKKYNSISCGSLLEVKNIDFIIDVVYSLKNYYPNYTHAHAGKNGNMYPELLEKVKFRGLQKNFIFMGELKNLDGLYSNAELFIHASTNEGVPNVIIEAMSFSLPIITSNWGDTSFFVINEKNGQIINNKNPEVWANVIKNILKNNALRAKMRINSLDIAKQKFDIKYMYSDLIKIYSEVLS
jgi:glycosyltransferase involved in cell wall biosynthesis